MMRKMTKKVPETTDGCPFEKAERLALEAVADPSKKTEYENATSHARHLERGGYRGRIAMGNGKTQVEKLIHHMMEHGPISQREAMIDYHVSSLTRRICDIEEMGYVVHRKENKNPVTGNVYTRYWINKAAPGKMDAFVS